MALVIVEGIDPLDVGDVCVRVCEAITAGKSGVVDCDVSAVTNPDVATVDGLARVCLAARRAGGRIRLVHPSPELCDLIELAGLSEALGVVRATGVGAATRRAGTSAPCRGRT